MDRANKKFRLCLLLALLFVALTGSTLTRPLSRAKFDFSPDVVQFHAGIISHTFLEVSAVLPDFVLATNSFRTNDLQVADQSHGQSFEHSAFAQPANWQIHFSRVHRRVFASESGDSDHGA